MKGQTDMKIEEALTKTCCQNTENLCAGRDCMAWRWKPLMADENFLHAVKLVMDKEGLPHAKAVKYVTENRAEYGLPMKPFDGYCGLAGIPQI